MHSAKQNAMSAERTHCPEHGKCADIGHDSKRTACNWLQNWLWPYTKTKIVCDNLSNLFGAGDAKSTLSLLATALIQVICIVTKISLNLMITPVNVTGVVTSLLYVSWLQNICTIFACSGKCFRHTHLSNSIKQCFRMGQAHLNSLRLQFNNDQCGDGVHTRAAATFIQHMITQLPLPLPLSTPNATSKTTESSMSLRSYDLVNTRYSSIHLVKKDSENINHNDNNNNNQCKSTQCDEWEKRRIQPAHRSRKRVQSKTGFAHLSSLTHDVRKMFISIIIPLILLCKIVPMSSAGK